MGIDGHNVRVVFSTILQLPEQFSIYEDFRVSGLVFLDKQPSKEPAWGFIEGIVLSPIRRKSKCGSQKEG